MPRLQTDSTLAALTRNMGALPIPSWMGDDTDMHEHCVHQMITLGTAGFTGLCYIRENRKGEFVAVPCFSAAGKRKTLGRHLLPRAAFIADLYRIFIYDKFIKPRLSDKVPLPLNFDWDAGMIENLRYEEEWNNVVEALIAWFRALGLLREPGVFPNPLTDELRAKAAQARFHKRSQFGELSFNALAELTRVAKHLDGANALMQQSILGGLQVSADQFAGFDTRLAKLETLLTAVANAVIGNVPASRPRCSLCLSQFAEPGSDHCARCQPSLVATATTYIPPEKA